MALVVVDDVRVLVRVVVRFVVGVVSFCFCFFGALECCVLWCLLCVAYLRIVLCLQLSVLPLRVAQNNTRRTLEPTSVAHGAGQRCEKWSAHEYQGRVVIVRKHMHAMFLFTFDCMCGWKCFIDLCQQSRHTATIPPSHPMPTRPAPPAPPPAPNLTHHRHTTHHTPHHTPHHTHTTTTHHITDMTPEHYFCCAQCNIVTLGIRLPLQPFTSPARM